jgi:hypothetical protein
MSQHYSEQPWFAGGEHRVKMRSDRRPGINHQSTLIGIGDHPGVGSIQRHRTRVRRTQELDVAHDEPAATRGYRNCQPCDVFHHFRQHLSICRSLA